MGGGWSRNREALLRDGFVLNRKALSLESVEAAHG